MDVLRTLTRANRQVTIDEEGETSQNSVAAMHQMLLDGGNHLERVTGEVAHAWLEHIAHEGLHAWDARRITDSSEQILVQLSRKGLQPRQCLTAQAIVRDTLTATLEDDRGRWLLGQPAQREWRLLDSRGKQLVVDLAFETEDGWLVVDYKTSQAHPGESPLAFETRMRTTYASQLRRYCKAVAAATGRPTRAALYLPRTALWLDFTGL